MGHRNRLLAAGAAAALAAAMFVPAGVGKPGTPDEPSLERTFDVDDLFGLTGGTVTDVHLFTGADGTASATLLFEGEILTLDLAPHDIRTDGYHVLVQQADGTMAVAEPPESKTMRGIVREWDDAKAAVSIIDGQLVGTILLGDGSTVVIEPLSDRMPDAEVDEHVVYRGESIIPRGGTCEVDDSFFVGAQGGITAGVGDCGGLCVAEFAADADYEYFLSRGSSVANVEAQIEAIIDQVNLQYENAVGIRHVITGIVVRTEEPDPYTTNNANTLLDQMTSEWQSNNFFPHDLAQLFSGKNFQGSTIGLAWLGSVCTSLKYSIVEVTCCPSFGCKTDLTAHECGHNWSAVHQSCNCTMNPSIVCANIFIQNTINAIVAYRNSIFCLDSAPDQDPPGFFTLINPVGTIDTVLNPVFQWNAASGADGYTLVVDDDPDFSSPVLDFTTGQTQLSTPPNFFDEGTTYIWKVTAFNEAGTRDSFPATTIFTTLSTDEPCPEDLDGDGTVNLNDLNILLTAFNTTDAGDTDGDGDTDLDDLNAVLAAFDSLCP